MNTRSTFQPRKAFDDPTNIGSKTSNQARANDGLMTEEEFFQGFTMTVWKDLRTSDRIRYQLKNGLYRSGGWITHISPDDKYLCFKSHGGVGFSLQADAISKIYHLPIARKKEKLVMFRHVDASLKHKVYIDDILVASFKTDWELKRFQKTKKYVYASDTKKFQIL